MSTRSRLLLDLGMFAAMLVAFNPGWTGISLHEWLSAAVLVPLLFHVIINWDWTVHATRKLLDRLRTLSRVNLLVDVGLFVATVSVMLSGLMVSQSISAFLGVAIAPGAIWIAVHSVSADATIALLAVHLVLHWKWVVDALAASGRSPVTVKENR